MEDPAVADVESVFPLLEPLSSFTPPGPFFRHFGQAQRRLRLKAFEVL